MEEGSAHDPLGNVGEKEVLLELSRKPGRTCTCPTLDRKRFIHNQCDEFQAVQQIMPCLLFHEMKELEHIISGGLCLSRILRICDDSHS